MVVWTRADAARLLDAVHLVHTKEERKRFRAGLASLLLLHRMEGKSHLFISLACGPVLFRKEPCGQLESEAFIWAREMHEKLCALRRLCGTGFTPLGHPGVVFGSFNFNRRPRRTLLSSTSVLLFSCGHSSVVHHYLLALPFLSALHIRHKVMPRCGVCVRGVWGGSGNIRCCMRLVAQQGDLVIRPPTLLELPGGLLIN